MFFNLGAKVKRVSGPPFDNQNHLNSEEKERKIVHNDKWPIPFESFQAASADQKRIFFHSAYPSFEIGPKVEIDLQLC